MAEYQIRGPLSESEVVSAFEKEGIEYDTRSDRYQLLQGTMFEQSPAQYWVYYNDTLETGKPIAAQGIAPYKDVYLLSGLKSYVSTYLDRGDFEYENIGGAGGVVSRKVIDMHGNKPIIGLAKPNGVKNFLDQGFSKIQIENGKVMNQDDVPEDVKDVIESVNSQGSSVTPIRKLYYKPVAKWFYVMRR